MEKTFIALFSVLMLAGCANDLYKIDAVATANAQWEVGEVIKSEEHEDDQVIIRQKWFFSGMTMDGAYLISDETYLEYSEENWASIEDTPENCNLLNGRIVHAKSDPYRILNIKSWESEINPASASDGKYRSFYVSGQRHYDCDFKGGDGTCMSWYQSGEKRSETVYAYGDPISSIQWFKNGQKNSEWMMCMHFSCANEKAWSEKKVWNLDGKLVSEEVH